MAHSVGEGFVVGGLADTHGLCGNAETGAVHEGHHVLDQTELAAAAEFCLGVLVDKFASRASVNTELVFDAANVHATVTLVIDEHGKAAGVVRAFFGAGEHQVNVGVAVRDEALHAVLLYGGGSIPLVRTRLRLLLSTLSSGCSDAAPATPGLPHPPAQCCLKSSNILYVFTKACVAA